MLIKLGSKNNYTVYEISLSRYWNAGKFFGWLILTLWFLVWVGIFGTAIYQNAHPEYNWVTVLDIRQDQTGAPWIKAQNSDGSTEIFKYEVPTETNPFEKQIKMEVGLKYRESTPINEKGANFFFPMFFLCILSAVIVLPIGLGIAGYLD